MIKEQKTSKRDHVRWPQKEEDRHY